MLEWPALLTASICIQFFFNFFFVFLNFFLNFFSILFKFVSHFHFSNAAAALTVLRLVVEFFIGDSV